MRRSLDGDGALLRIELSLAGDDPRVALRKTMPAPEELPVLGARLIRLDASSQEPWTARYLQLIATQPGVISHTLAKQVRSVEARAQARRYQRTLWRNVLVVPTDGDLAPLESADNQCIT